ncbi:MAG: hypothetical protein ACJA2U_001045 [Marinomonas primoryensis]|jgi:hypothetical protein
MTIYYSGNKRKTSNHLLLDFDHDYCGTGNSASAGQSKRHSEYNEIVSAYALVESIFP